MCTALVVPINMVAKFFEKEAKSTLKLWPLWGSNAPLSPDVLFTAIKTKYSYNLTKEQKMNMLLVLTLVSDKGKLPAQLVVSVTKSFHYVVPIATRIWNRFQNSNEALYVAGNGKALIKAQGDMVTQNLRVWSWIYPTYHVKACAMLKRTLKFQQLPLPACIQ